MADKTRWLLLRGLSRETAHWGDFPERLRAAVPGAEVTCLDLPGVGRYREERSPRALPQITDLVRSRFQAQGAGPKPYLLALSFGGMVATRWLFQYPDELAGAVLVNTSLNGYSPLFRRLTPKAAALVLRALCRPDLERREREVLRLVSKSPWDDARAAAWIAIQRERPVTRTNAIRQLMAAGSYAPPRRAPRVPTLLLNSLGDELAHPDCSRDIAEVWGSPLETHPWAGHDLPFDDPDWIARAAALWQRSLTQS